MCDLGFLLDCCIGIARRWRGDGIYLHSISVVYNTIRSVRSICKALPIVMIIPPHGLSGFDATGLWPKASWRFYTAWVARIVTALCVETRMLLERVDCSY